MQSLVAPVFLLLLLVDLSIAHHSLKHDIEEDLEKLGVTCHHDSCTSPRTTDSLNNFACQCGVNCSKLGTCCIDSPYLLLPPTAVVRPTCSPSDRYLHGGRSYLMVDHCPKDNDFRDRCEEEWYGDEDEKKVVPVTSLFSSVTYKNYFCFRCHETTDDFVYWDVRVRRSEEFDQTLRYDRKNKTWFAPLAPNTAESQMVSVEAPAEVRRMISECDPLVISNCSRLLTDDEKIRDKCEAYMSVVQIAHKDNSVRKYRNVHCALCNQEDLSNVLCEKSPVKKRALPFSFTMSLDTSRRNATKKADRPQCEKDFVWDPYFRKCRKLQCALPGFVLRNGKCVRQ